MANPKPKPTRLTTAAGLRRAAHFADGGTIAGWRGRARRIPDPKGVAARAACRGPFRQED